MKLSEINIDYDYDLLKDGNFEFLAFVNQRTINRKSLIFIEDEKYLNFINLKLITCVVVKSNINIDRLTKEHIGILQSDNPRLVFHLINENYHKSYYSEELFESQISKSAEISSKSNISEKNVIIGNGSLIEDNVVVYPNVFIGNQVKVRSGSILGSPAFSFYQHKGFNVRVKTTGNVVLDDYVEIQNNSIVDKPAISGTTRICKGVKVDNMVHIGHDVYIGENSIITAGVIISGFVNIEKSCLLGVNSTIRNQVSLGTNSKVSMGAVVSRDVKENTRVTGNLAIKHEKFMETFKNIYVTNKVNKWM